MISLKKIRLPYREDPLFGWLFLIVLVVPLAFNLYNHENYETIKFAIVSIFLGFGLISFIKNNSAKKTFNLRIDAVFLKILAAFIFWIFIVCLFALDKNYAFFGFYQRFTNGFIFMFEMALLLFLLSSVALDKLNFLIKTLFFTGTLVALWGIIQSLGFGYYASMATGLFSRSAPSFLGNTNFSSMFVAALVPVGLYFFNNTSKNSYRIYFALSLFIQICGIIIFSSRGSILGLVCGLFFSIISGLFFTKPKIGKFLVSHIAALAVLLVLSMVFFNFIRPGAVATTVSFKDVNIQNRLGIWGVSVKSFFEHPIVGVGLGNFELVFEAHRSATGINVGFFDDPHNLFLMLLVTGGAPLLFLFILLPAYGVFYFFKNSKGLTLELYGIAVMGSIISWIVASMFTPVPVPCYVLLVFLISALFVKENNLIFLDNRWFKVGIIFTGIIIALFGVSFLIAENIFFYSTRVYNEQDFKKSASLSKMAINFFPFNNFYYEYLAASDIRTVQPQSVIEKDLNNFSKFHTKRAYTYIQLANLNYLQVFQNQDQKLMAKVFSNLDKAIELDPYSASNYFDLAQYYLVDGNAPKATEAALKALNLSPSASDGWLLLAKIYQVQNNKQGTINAIEHERELDPENPQFQALLHKARDINDIRQLPLRIGLNIGQLD